MEKQDEKELYNLIDRVRSRDDSAFAMLLSKYSPMLNGVIAGFSSSLVSYSEAFSEATVALFRAAASYEIGNGSVTFGLYAKICVYRRLCDLYNKVKHDSNIVDLDVDKIPVNSNAEQRLVGIERMREYLAKAQKLLSEYEYEVFLLYIEGYDNQSIAKRLSKDVKSVENAKTRMLRNLRGESELFSDI